MYHGCRVYAVLGSLRFIYLFILILFTAIMAVAPMLCWNALLFLFFILFSRYHGSRSYVVLGSLPPPNTDQQ
jgi:hypothetical protein